MSDPFKETTTNGLEDEDRKVSPSSLRAEAQRLIAEGKMPDLDTLLTAVAEVRQEYVPLIIAARKRVEHES